MFQKVLVANRGEIAVRLIQTLKERGITSVAVYSQADRDALHVKLADAAVCIGPAKASASYLNMQNIVSAAVLTGADAIHPGFGFLAENADFADLCARAHVAFIGPRPETIRQLGDKAVARRTVAALGVPVIPGSAELTSLGDAQAAAATLGYPVMLKAAAGGGGKGIRLIDSEATLISTFGAAQAEAQASFGDPAMYLEKIIRPAKHIEVQVLADRHGHVWTFPERDCSLQRHSQKVLEVSPSLTMTPPQRTQVQQLAATIATGVGYENAGTIEFLQDRAGAVYFMEMNTRIQVEHPVSEMVTGVALLARQIDVAAGADLGVSQALAPTGVAIECRINAEDPANGFAPAAGTLTAVRWPLGGAGVRVDRGVDAGDLISPFYDSMIAKLIAHAETAPAAWAKMARMLAELQIHGVRTTQRMHQALVQDARVQAGTATTDYLTETWLAQWQAEGGTDDEQ
ncbi:acetyl-CoA carboxylase biotin carboxylase subunit [Lacticaseibacillus absianus]|uniref:acetyl-CoA carboxylase biotin carboxylase subunit n=1 Tax=Lacticaseibacillus absianus TaxID=2729623 RepID=UPI0015C970E6|nr:biotin carboxylase N-terminal domain-containing protein [Lacticaseibacillus absianus]